MRTKRNYKRGILAHAVIGNATWVDPKCTTCVMQVCVSPYPFVSTSDRSPPVYMLRGSNIMRWGQKPAQDRNRRVYIATFLHYSNVIVFPHASSLLRSATVLRPQRSNGERNDPGQHRGIAAGGVGGCWRAHVQAAGVPVPLLGRESLHRAEAPREDRGVLMRQMLVAVAAIPGHVRRCLPAVMIVWCWRINCLCAPVLLGS